MSDSLYIAATGMQAQQLNVDTIANNLVNMTTPGFKRGRVAFTDMMATEATRMGAMGGSTSPEAGLLGSLPRLGAGVGISSVTKSFEPGVLNPTNSAWDLGIQGEGFIQVVMPDGSVAYSRGGTLKVNQEGLLSTQGGQPLKGSVAIPANATGLTISTDGRILVSLPNQLRPMEVGQLQLARFTHPGGLTVLGDGLYRESEASGEAMVGGSGQDGIGTLQQGVLEGSNVKMVDEMVNLMVAQRSYEASVKVVQASDELLGMINNLRK